MRRVYLDNVSTTPIIPEVREAMLPFLDEFFGNPSCIHDWGDTPREAMEVARSQVADLISASPEEIIFTGSGTESNNFAVKGLALAQQAALCADIGEAGLRDDHRAGGQTRRG
jgi:cysteine desulfurase